MSESLIRPRLARAWLDVLARLFHPRHILNWLRIRSSYRGTAYADTQLQFYAKALPSGFLHYGYFADPQTDPRDIGIARLEQAQLDYALKLMTLIADPSAPMLDVGCGMGGLARLLHERNVPVVALTPDRYQAAHVRQMLPDVEVLECRFEKIAAENHDGRYGTIITSESLQYLRLHKALPLIDRILKPGGRWVACDYFRTDRSVATAGHLWTDFTEQLARANLRIVFQEDITANIQPSLAFIHMLGERFVRPVVEFSAVKLELKRPRLHYLLTPAIDHARQSLGHHLQKVDPAYFGQRKRYMLLAIERAM